LTKANNEGYCVKVLLKKGTLMKHPFWLTNSALLVFLLLTVVFVFLSRPKAPERSPFEPTEIRPIKQEMAKIDLSKIYTNDLFDTYKQPLPPIGEPTYGKPMPLPPKPALPPMPAKQPLKFLEPLKITLRGIMVSSDERLNVAIIEGTKEATPKNYKVGDTLEDAQLIRILKNKIILIRSNGQQETLYVTQHDAELEQLLMPNNNWSLIIKRIDENSYTLDPDLFIERIHSLAQCIDALNLTTVYRQGKSFGCRIGALEKNSLGIALGLAQGDIIERINDIPATDTSSRFTIYKMITAMKPSDIITLNVIRKNQPLSIQYRLEKFEATTPLTTFTEMQALSPMLQPEIKTPQEIDEEKRKILEQKYRFAPTAEELQKNEKQAMLKMSQRAHRPNRGALMNNVQP
jgi:type II secretion system protein C